MFSDLPLYVQDKMSEEWCNGSAWNSQKSRDSLYSFLSESGKSVIAR